MKSKTPLVYIVLPIYNGEKYFLEQLMSLYYQNYTNWFLIIVNDWSIDNSETIARDWVSHYNLHEKVKILNKENWWVTSAVQRWLEEIMNLCDIEKSDSYVAYCDADDIWTRDKMLIQVNYMVNHPEYGLSYHDLAIVDENWWFLKPSQLDKYWHNESFLYNSTIWGYFSSISMMYRVKYVKYILPMPIWKEFAQDYWTSLVLSLLNVGIWFMDKSLCYRRMRESSLSKVHNQDFFISRQKYYKFLQERFLEKDLSYIISCNQDWMINRRKYGRLYMVFRMFFKYPRVFFLCFRMWFYKLKKFMRKFLFISK